MVLTHEPGDKLFVDFAGKMLPYIDRGTGELLYCPVFVACLPRTLSVYSLNNPDKVM